MKSLNLPGSLIIARTRVGSLRNSSSSSARVGIVTVVMLRSLQSCEELSDVLFGWFQPAIGWQISGVITRWEAEVSSVAFKMAERSLLVLEILRLVPASHGCYHTATVRAGSRAGMVRQAPVGLGVRIAIVVLLERDLTEVTSRVALSHGCG